MEELHRDSLSGLGRGDPGTLAAWSEARDLEDKLVYDVNGARLGRIRRCFAEDGSLLRVDIRLDRTARKIFGAESDQYAVGIPRDWIAAVDENGVRLSHAGEELLHPEDPRPLHAEADERGAPDLPRKER